eukprot:XP_001695081.1 serine/threonine protein kinase 4 [Chlamydomonas reinhardtii]
MLSFLAGCVFKALTGGDLREDLSCMLNALPEALGVPRLCKATASDIRSPCFPCNGQKVVRRPLWDPRATLAAASPAPVLEAMKESPTPPVSSSGDDCTTDGSALDAFEERHGLQCWRSEGKIGRGGYGLVHVGLLQRPDGTTRPVAAKLFLGGLTKAKEQLNRELPMMVMELAKGCVASVLDVALLPLKQVLAILVSLAAAIKAMHRVGLVHNDVKPANMLHRADDTYCLADFGLAEQLSPADPTGTFFFEMACGTRHYMAPEVQSNVPLTAAVDVYSFGITALCVAVTGSNSAAADWFAQQSWWPAGDAPAAARAFPAGIFPSYLPLSLELLLLDCVAWDPQERPTAEQVVQRLAAIWEEVVVCGY